MERRIPMEMEKFDGTRTNLKCLMPSSCFPNWSSIPTKSIAKAIIKDIKNESFPLEDLKEIINKKVALSARCFGKRKNKERVYGKIHLCLERACLENAKQWSQEEAYLCLQDSLFLISLYKEQYLSGVAFHTNVTGQENDSFYARDRFLFFYGHGIRDIKEEAGRWSYASKQGVVTGSTDTGSLVLGENGHQVELRGSHRLEIRIPKRRDYAQKVTCDFRFSPNAKNRIESGEIYCAIDDIMTIIQVEFCGSDAVPALKITKMQEVYRVNEEDVLPYKVGTHYKVDVEDDETKSIAAHFLQYLFAKRYKIEI